MLRTIFTGHTGKVHGLAFIGSGTILFSASKDKARLKCIISSIDVAMLMVHPDCSSFLSQTVIEWDMLQSTIRHTFSGKEGNMHPPNN
jgi:WD40 repeat protein